MEVKKFVIDELPTSLWANGQGQTQVALCYPPGSSMTDFLWRLSFASITSPRSPFSVLPGVYRYLALVKWSDGLSGVRVSHSAHADQSFTLTELGSIACFDGAMPLVAEMVVAHNNHESHQSECRLTDFNLMLRSDAGVFAIPFPQLGATVVPFGNPPSVDFPAAVMGGLYVSFTQSRIRLVESEAVTSVEAGEGYWWTVADRSTVNSLSEVGSTLPLTLHDSGLGVAFAILRSLRGLGP